MLRTVLTATIVLFLSAPLFAASSDDLAIQQLSSSDPAVQIQACRTLGASKSTAAVNPLIKLLDSQNTHVQASAAAALGAIGEKGDATRAVLRTAQTTDNAVVRYAALAALMALAEDGNKQDIQTVMAGQTASEDELLADLAQKLSAKLQE